jgi:CxxC-x17-CxxC domain-containing protein
VFGNVGTLIIFRVGAADAEALAPEFSPVFNEEDIVNIPKYEFYIKLMIDGISSDPFSARGLPPLSEDEKTGNTEKVIGVSRERYAKNREIVEDKISRWHENSGGVEDEKAVPGGKMKRKENFKNTARPTQSNFRVNTPARLNGAEERRGKSDEVYSAPNNRFTAVGKNITVQGSGVYKYNAVCSHCGKETKVSFIPDGVRPVLCRECLGKARFEKKEEIDRRKRMKEDELQKMEQSRLEKQDFSSPDTAGARASDDKGISLKEAIGKGAVDFKGKSKADTQSQNRQNQSSVASRQEGELNEGEDIKFE